MVLTQGDEMEQKNHAMVPKRKGTTRYHTRERLIEEYCTESAEDRLIYLIHMAAYKFCLSYVQGKKVLDFGCGSGYGAALIADHCVSVIGVDVSEDAIRYASERYAKPNVEFTRISATEKEALPFPPETFDVVLSFQVIEHVRNVDWYFSNVYRVLTTEGVFIVVTPDRDWRLFPGQKPWNRFHITEYSREGLLNLLTSYFPHVEMLQMSGTKKLLEFELRRTRKLKYLTLPFTFCGAPEWWRAGGLRFLKLLQSGMKKVRVKRREGICDFCEQDVIISKAAAPSINLISLAKKSL